MNARHSLCVLAALILTAPALAQYDPSAPPRFNNNFEEEAPWQEAETELPAFPQDANLIEFYVSAVATNTYLIDGSTLAVGADGVIRYALVVKAAGGAKNISLEGIHCKERTWKTYATGRSDGTWTKARLSEWRPIENKPVNRHHASLSRDYFCPNGTAIATAAEGRDALKRGKHPDAN
jgi:hypothetical protein